MSRPSTRSPSHPTTTVLVAGGAGYIGAHTVRALRDAGHSVVVLDNLASGHAQALPVGVPLHRIDVGDTPRVEALLREYSVGAVMHFASLSAIPDGQHRPLEFYNANVGQTLGLLRAMERADVRHLIFSSSAAVYGAAHTGPIREDAPLAPTNVYGRTKVIVEDLLCDLDRVGALRYCALRYFNAAGACPSGQVGEHHTPETHLIPLLLQVALGQRDQLAVYGADYPTPDGTCVRDYVHVCDLARAHVLALGWLLGGHPSQIFNLGSGRGASVRELIACCRAITQHPIPTRDAPRRDGDVPCLTADSSRAAKLLGWTPTASLTDIVQSAWRWHRDHPNGYGTP